MNEQDQPGPSRATENKAVEQEPAVPPAGDPATRGASGGGGGDASPINKASHSYGGGGKGKGGEEREGQGIDQIKILRLGVDTLVLSFEGEIHLD